MGAGAEQSTVRDELHLPRLMLVGGPEECPGFAEVLDRGAAAGLTLFQLRVKDGPWPDGALLAEILRRHGALRLLVNGHAALARSLGVGLHLPETMARPHDWPTGRTWGRSVHGVGAARAAVREGVHYLVLGTVFPTPSKPGHEGGGLDLVRSVCHAVDLPVFAIGGVSVANAGAVLDAGAHGVAVRRAIWAAPRPEQAVRDLLEAVRDGVAPDKPRAEPPLASGKAS